MLQPGTSPFADCLVTQLAKAGSLASLLSAGTSEAVGLRLRRGTGCAVQGHAVAHACVTAWQGRRVGEMHEVALAASAETGFRDVDGVSDLVGLGAKGACPANVERDFHRRQARSSWLPHTMTVEIPIRTRRGGTKRVTWHVMPPHALFAAMLNNKRKDALVDDNCCLDDWWGEAAQCSNEGLNRHPALHLPQHDLRKLSNCIPIKTYGASILLAQPDFEPPRSTEAKS